MYPTINEKKIERERERRDNLFLYRKNMYRMEGSDKFKVWGKKIRKAKIKEDKRVE